MKTKLIRLACFLTALLALADVARAQGTAFTYQGRLTANGLPVNGSNDLTFTLYDAARGGATVGVGNVVNDLAVTNGLFTVALDFGAAFDGNARWLEIAVRPGASAGAYTNLTPRQPISATPYAMRALSAGNATTATSVTAGAVNNLALANDAVDGAKILNGSITSSDLNASLLTGTFWNLGGNMGTTPGAHFLGTTDYQPLEFRANGSRALRLEPTAKADTVNVIGGSARNFVGAGVVGATIGGGGAGNYLGGSYTNRVTADFGTVGGGNDNIASGGNATVAGGTVNTAGGFAATVGGGYFNTIQPNADYATIGGGYQSTIQRNALYATIGGGNGHSIQTNSLAATIGGGFGNKILTNSYSSTIGGGELNTINANAYYATISGGDLNAAAGAYSTVPGGAGNNAGGQFSFAAGHNAKANHTGAFVWADTSAGDFSSTGDYQFLIRARGGVGINTSTPNGAALAVQGNITTSGTIFGLGSGLTDLPAGQLAGNIADARLSANVALLNGNQTFTSINTIALSGSMSFGSQTRQMLNLYGTGYGLGVQASSLYFRCDNSASTDGFIWYKGGVHNDGYAQPGAGGTELMHLVQGSLYVNGALVPSSDRNAKENFGPVQPREVLEKVVALPLSSWNYKADTATRHLGPMAQDFYAAFNVGPDDKHIATVDADGVALAAIQGLNQKLEAETKAKDAEIESLKQNLAELKHLVQTLAATK